MNSTISIEGAVALTHWGVIRARGAEAGKFLHSQLTNDFSTLGLSEARLAGFCSAKGRLQASFLAWKQSHDEVLLACSASVLPATLKRLSMFILRTQCRLEDATAATAMWGISGPPAAALLGDASVWERRQIDSAVVIRLPDATGVQRCLWVASAEDGARPSAPAITLDSWRWLEVQSGVPTIEALTADQFVPQMLNFELLGGIDFKKGCYPGQEVVARSQYRGTIKRRMVLFDSDAMGAAGQEVFHSADTGQPAGMVVNAAPRPAGGGSSMLVEIKLAAMEGGTLHLGAPDGSGMWRTAMPYEVLLEPS